MEKNPRDLYIVENFAILSDKNKWIPINPEELKKDTLNTEKKINYFLKEQLNRQKKVLQKGGKYSKSGFKIIRKR